MNLDDVFEAVDKQMQTSETVKTTEIEQEEEGNTTLTMVKYPKMITLQLLTCTCIRSWLKVVEKGVSLSSKLKNISFQQLVNYYMSAIAYQHP